MEEYIRIEEIPLPINIQSYKNSKSVKILYKNGYLKITKPKWYSINKVKKYLKENSKEIYNKYIKYIKEERVNLLETKSRQITKILYKGEIFDVVLNRIKEKKIFIDLKDKCFEVNVYDGIEADRLNNLIKKELTNVLKELSKEYIIDRVQEISEELEIAYNSIKIKDCKTIWGSCSSKGNINFNYRLIHMPIWILDSVIIHELCHRKYLNHNKNFWNLVYSYYPKEKYIEAKKWLRNNIKLLNII